jgi:membrane protein DedA with SNARE-associated domain
MVDINFLILKIETFSYLAIFLIILASGVGIPFPEDAILLLSGYLASLEVLDLKWAIAICIIGLICSDNLGFYIGRRGGRIVNKVLSNSGVSHYRKHLCKKRTIFATRFLSGLRVFFPIAAGAANMRWKEFFIADTAAIFVLGIGLNLVGYYFGWAITPIIKGVLKFDKIITIVAISIIALIIGITFVFKKKKIHLAKKLLHKIHRACGIKTSN